MCRSMKRRGGKIKSEGSFARERCGGITSYRRLYVVLLGYSVPVSPRKLLRQEGVRYLLKQEESKKKRKSGSSL